MRSSIATVCDLDDCSDIKRLLDYVNDAYGADMVYDRGIITATYTSRAAYAALLLATKSHLRPHKQRRSTVAVIWDCKLNVGVAPQGADSLWEHEISGIMQELNPALVRYYSLYGDLPKLDVVASGYDINGIMFSQDHGNVPVMDISIIADFSECVTHYPTALWPPPNPIDYAYKQYLDCVLGMCEYIVGVAVRVPTGRPMFMGDSNVRLQVNHAYSFDIMIAAVERCIDDVQLIARVVNHTRQRVSAQIGQLVYRNGTVTSTCENYTYTCQFVIDQQLKGQPATVDMAYTVLNGAVVPRVVSVTVDSNSFSRDGIRNLKQLFLSV